MKNFTERQRDVITSRSENLLVSASAGTGKTTVMVERICRMIENGEADVGDIIVVTFTNLAAAEMKKRLTEKLSQKKFDPRIAEQLEKIDAASVCTLHSFCSDLLRNYFYVADVDPAFVILDNVTVASLKKNALTEVFAEYYAEKDEVFQQVYQIFATNRREDNFRETILSLYEFGRCLEDFSSWYAEKRQNFLCFKEGNPVLRVIEEDITVNLSDISRRFGLLADDCTQEGAITFAAVCRENARITADFGDLESALYNFGKIRIAALPCRNSRKERPYGTDSEAEERLRANFKSVKDDYDALAAKYAKLCAGKSLGELEKETEDSVVFADKLAEITTRFENKYFAAKKRRGGLDFGDLEHLALKILDDAETVRSIRSRYKYLFVDEYQDTNPVQEALLSRLYTEGRLFTVGDVKQSIYGFRGCEPGIFLEKYDRYKRTGQGKVVELNANFRSNREILEFVNTIFCRIMTEDFGKVDYDGSSRLTGSREPSRAPSVRIDIIAASEEKKKEAEGVYDITGNLRDSLSPSLRQGELIARRISECVGSAYKNKSGQPDRIRYGDIVVLMRSMTDKAADIYNCLVGRNIPVVANFKAKGYRNKEIRDIINLLRVIDNPYCDVYLAGVCLSHFGKFTETELSEIKLASDDVKCAFITRLDRYVGQYKNGVISAKIDSLKLLLEKLRFFSRGACVEQTVLEILKLTDFHLYVQGLPNGNMRIRRLYAFIDDLKGKTYSQSIDKFLQYLDESDEAGSEEAIPAGNAVRMMTMHAAKGLEFPVVIIAGTETPFKNESVSVEKNSDMGIAVRHYDFSAMKVSPTLGATASGMFNAVKRKEEEMRLLYVALTRAENLLIVVGAGKESLLSSPPKPSRNAVSHLEWIVSALKTEYGSLYDGLCRGGAAVSVIRESVERAEPQSADLLCPQYADAEKVLKAIRYRYPHAEATAIPGKIVSSALDRAFIYDDVDRTETVVADDGDRNFVGTAYHKVYEYADYDADRQAIRELISALTECGKIEKIHADKLDVELIYSTLHNPELRSLMSSGKVYHELPFMVSVPYRTLYEDSRCSDEVILQGVIDMLITDGKKAVVVDFKYTAHSRFVRQNYSRQLSSYRTAVSEITGIKDIDCYVLSVSDNKLIKM